MSHAPRTLRDLVALGLTLLAVLVPATAARADDATAAWAVAPSDAAGAPTGQTRYELEVAPGETVTEHALLTNSSTVERAFAVYGADGFNTPTGGYDVGAAAVAPTDVGSWVTAAASPVTVPALSTAVIEFTVAVPDGATPGDHPGGLVVSPVRTQVTADGVQVDTRVAVRLNVRVAGEVTPALEVRDVGASYAFTPVPFAPAPVTVRYDVVNTGNVKVVGVPRLRITGPFGIRLAEVAAEQTHEVLPGDAFTVETVVDSVAPWLVDIATVDVEMVAAPGPTTEIPLVSSTARTTFAAVPWTGLALLAVVVTVGAALIRRRRRRAAEAEQLWDRVVDEARADIEAGRSPRSGLGQATAAVALAVALVAAPGPDAFAQDDEGAITLTVPTAAPTPGASGAGGSGSRSGGARAPGAASPPAVTDDGQAPPDAPDDVTVTAQDGPAPDLIWSQASGWGPREWAVAGVGGLGGLVGLGYLVRLLLVRRGVLA